MVRLDKAHLSRCTHCGSWIRLPRPSAQEQASLHDTPEYFEHPYFQDRRHDQDDLDRRCREVFARITGRTGCEWLSSKRVLDIGCDTGSFLASAAMQFDIVPVGVDVSSRVVTEAIKRGIEAYHTDLETAPAHLQDFPLITAIDVIEHVVSPRAFLQAVCARLCSGGMAYIETPNIGSTIYQVGRILCNATNGRPRHIFERLFPAEHIQYFTCAGLSGLARDCGFEVVQLEKRSLPIHDIAVSLLVRLGVGGLQLIDRLIGDTVLICIVLRRP